MDPTPSRPAVAVVAPALSVSVAIERRAGGGLEVHFHAGGQGFWVARLVARLGVSVSLCAPLGGEPGQVLRGLIESDGVTPTAVAAREPNVVISDRREGEPASIAETPPRPLSRHELDDLYRRLAVDLRANGVRVVADLSGDPLRAALEGGWTSSRSAMRGSSPTGTPTARMRRPCAAASTACGRRAPLPCSSRGPASRPSPTPASALEISPPRLEPLNHRGGGDSRTAAAAAALAAGHDLEHALRVAAAGALNVTRQGLGTDDPRSIERLTEHVGVADAGEGGET